MTIELVAQLAAPPCEPDCCCPCRIDLDVLILGSNHRGTVNDVVAANADCNGVLPNRDTNGHYAHDANVFINASSTITIPHSGGCAQVVADFHHWEISCDGATAYEDTQRNTVIDLAASGACNCQAVAVFVPRQTPVIVQCLALELCRETACTGGWNPLYLDIVSYGDYITQPTTIAPRGVPLSCGYGYLRPCQGGPSSVTICFDPAPWLCGGCHDGTSVDCPPYMPARGTLCRIEYGASGMGASCATGLCSAGPCVTIALTCLNACTGGCGAAAVPYYALLLTDGSASCSDCWGHRLSCP